MKCLIIWLFAILLRIAVWTILGFRHFKLKIETVDIHKPRLTSNLSGKLTDAFNSLTHLQRVTIESPIEIDSLPHPTDLRCLRLLNLPQYSETWQWVASLQSLEEMEVSTSGSRPSLGTVRVVGDKAKLDNVEETTQSMLKFMINIPENLKKKVPGVFTWRISWLGRNGFLEVGLFVGECVRGIP